jgi:hypothetical protein
LECSRRHPILNTLFVYRAAQLGAAAPAGERRPQIKCRDCIAPSAAGTPQRVFLDAPRCARQTGKASGLAPAPFADQLLHRPREGVDVAEVAIDMFLSEFLRGRGRD